MLLAGLALLAVAPRQLVVAVLDDRFADQLLANFRDSVCDIVQFPPCDENNAHSEDPMRNAGRVTGLSREGDKIMATIEVRKPEVAEGIKRGTILSASAS